MILVGFNFELYYIIWCFDVIFLSFWVIDSFTDCITLYYSKIVILMDIYVCVFFEELMRKACFDSCLCYEFSIEIMLKILSMFIVSFGVCSSKGV